MEIIIRNTGKLPVRIVSQRIEGADKDLFSFPPIENYTLLPDSIILQTVTFKPEPSTNGLKTASIITSIFMDEETVEYSTVLRGERVTIEYNIPDEVSVEAEIGTSQTEDITLTNTGKYSFIINDAKLMTNDYFSLSPNIVGARLGSGEFKTFTISYSSLVAGNHTDTLTIKMRSDNCDYEKQVLLKGYSYIPVEVSLPDVTAQAGVKDYCIPMSAKILSKIPESLNISYNAKISMEPQIILPSVPSVVTTDVPERIISVSAQNIPVSRVESKLNEICGYTMLAEDDYSPLKIIEFTKDNPDIRIFTKDGSLSIAGVCVQNARAVRIFTQTTMTILPFPAQDRAEIYIQSGEEGIFMLSVYTITGELIDRLSPFEKGGQKGDFFLDLKDYPAGLYQVILHTQQGVASGKLAVVK